MADRAASRGAGERANAAREDGAIESPAIAAPSAPLRDSGGGGWIGRTVGNYVLDSVLGQGGMGLVFAARHRFLGDRVAVKLLHGALEGDKTIARRFFQEAKTTRAIVNPHIVRILDFGQEESQGALYLVMELLEGAPLSRLLAHRTLDEPEALRIAAAVADGLEAAHAQGVVHRDLKPANVFLLFDGTVKILDFGIAKLAASQSGEQTRTGAMLGTPQYMAPEQAKRSSAIGPWTDVYALGCMTFKMLTGRLPFRGDDMAEVIAQHLFDQPPRPSELVPGLTPEVERIVLDCLEKEPSRRPPSMAAVRDRLVAVLGATGASTELSAPPALVRRALEEAPRSLIAEPPSSSDSVGDDRPKTVAATPARRRAARAGAAPPGASSPDAPAAATLGSAFDRPARKRWVPFAIAAVATPLVGLAIVGAVLLASSGSGAPTAITSPATGGSAPPAAAATAPRASAPPASAPTDPATAGAAQPESDATAAHISVETDPPNARVLVDGEERGTTPVALDVQLPVELALELRGYRREVVTVRMPGVVRIPLAPEAHHKKPAAASTSEAPWHPATREGLD